MTEKPLKSIDEGKDKSLIDFWELIRIISQWHLQEGGIYFNEWRLFKKESASNRRTLLGVTIHTYYLH